MALRLHLLFPLITLYLRNRIRRIACLHGDDAVLHEIRDALVLGLEGWPANSKTVVLRA